MARKKKAEYSAELLSAIGDADDDVVAELLAKGADPNVANDEDVAALVLACEVGELGIVERLLDAGADVNVIAEARQETPLMRAVKSGNAPLVELLLARGANVRHQNDDDDGNTALTLAVDPNDTTTPSAGVVRALLRGGADPNVPNADGWTPLMNAAHFPDLEIVDLLLAAGADVAAVRGSDVRAVDVADSHGHHAIVAKLVARGSPTPLETATLRMRGTWERIGDWFKDKAPAYYERLKNARGASLRELDELEELFEVRLPSDFRAYLASYGGAGAAGAAFYEYRALSVAEIRQAWQKLEALHAEGRFARPATPRERWKLEEVAWAFWDAGWIPFAEDEGGNLFCVDMQPSPSGRRGQVIRWSRASGPANLLAPNFDIFLDDYCEDLELDRASLRGGVVVRK